jgi:hypothetical protein
MNSTHVRCLVTLTLEPMTQPLISKVLLVLTWISGATNTDGPDTMSKGPIYSISITGLRLKSFASYPPFWWYTIPALEAAKSAAGNVVTDTSSEYYKYGTCTHYTLTVWQDRSSTKAYVRSPEHMKAMKMSGKITS